MDSDDVMKVHGAPEVGDSDRFEGYVELETVRDEDAHGRRVAMVRFYSGAFTRWHLHRGEQTLVFTAGRGWVAYMDGDPISCRPGDIAHVGADVKHAHGANSDGDAAHIAITDGETIWDHDERFKDYPSRPASGG